MANVEYFASAFVEAASVPLDGWHASGTLDHAQEILLANPEIAKEDIYTAAILGDENTVRQFLAEDPESATRIGGVRRWDALTYLCFSRYLKLDSTRSDAFVKTAAALLDAGAHANTGWWEENHQPKPEWESALYGACGIAHHPGVTQLLLDHGADPNDGETVYHTPETHDNRSLKVLVASKKLTPESLALLLIRKHDWHDFDGAKWLLENGADPNQVWGTITPLLQAIRRDNDVPIFEVLLDHGGDPSVVVNGLSGTTIAAQRGRKDLLDLFEKRGISLDLSGLDALIAACARCDATAVRTISDSEPDLAKQLVAEGGRWLAMFSGNGNTCGVRTLLNAGVPASALFKEGDGYFGIAENSTALHVAAWRMRPDIVKLLIERGADVNAKDARFRTPLMLAVRACVDSYWTERRTPESVEVLLNASASTKGVEFPSGYEAVDDLLRPKM